MFGQMSDLFIGKELAFLNVVIDATKNSLIAHFELKDENGKKVLD